MLDLYRRDYAPGARQEPHTHALPSIALLAQAGELAMHPIALARAFRRAASLIGSNMPLAAVALESGFSDQSHFCRHFKLELGLTPAAFRGLIHSRPATCDNRY